MRRPESGESLSQLPQQQRPPVLAKRIEARTARPLIVEDLEHNIRMEGKMASLPHVDNEGTGFHSLLKQNLSFLV